MRYAEAIEFLYKLQSFGMTLGLERARKLAELCGNPQDQLRFIHVAGTNGKGSTCAMLESIYRHSGYRTGLYTSPHLVSFSERIQVDRRLIPESEVARLVEQMREHLKEFPADQQPSFFEVVTVMALQWFAEQKCDIVIWETGLGGRLDATNIVTPLASVITNIQFDHEKWLGHTLAEIAREKAGIIKPGLPVIAFVEEEEAWRVIKDIALTLRSPINRFFRSAEEFRSSLLGRHQVANAILTVHTVRTLKETLPFDWDKLHAGLQNVHWPGRFDLRGRYILDGAHNPAGAKTLRETIEATFPDVRPVFIVGILADKDIAGIVRELAPVVGEVFTVSVGSDRAADAESIARLFRSKALGEFPVHACASLAEALEASENAERVVITGSLHFIGEAMELLGFGAGPSERGLNDWSQAPR